MTILPKKKVGQAKNESENKDNVQHHGGHGHLQNIASQDSLNRDIIYPTRTSPPRWHTSVPIEGSSAAEFDDYFECLESSGGPCHSSSKRCRHRASPHRSLSRKGHGHLHHRNTSSPQNPALISTTVNGHSDSSVSEDQDVEVAPVSMQENEDHTGYNSGDEYGPHPGSYAWSPEEWEEVNILYISNLIY